ncbi:MAG: hypothetical protein IBX56_19840 [Methylomicrobium sp.]|nr:hypothetical protein [Methylomicrobium sp.]
MAKILNLDGLSEEKEVKLIIDGTAHFLKKISVADFIKLVKYQEEMEKREAELEKKGQHLPVYEKIEFMAESAAISFPTIGVDRLKELTVDELYTIVEFARDASMPDEEEADAEKKDQAQKSA